MYFLQSERATDQQLGTLKAILRVHLTAQTIVRIKKQREKSEKQRSEQETDPSTIEK